MEEKRTNGKARGEGMETSGLVSRAISLSTPVVSSVLRMIPPPSSPSGIGLHLACVDTYCLVSACHLSILFWDGMSYFLLSAHLGGVGVFKDISLIGLSCEIWIIYHGNYTTEKRRHFYEI